MTWEVSITPAAPKTQAPHVATGRCYVQAQVCGGTGMHYLKCALAQVCIGSGVFWPRCVLAQVYAGSGL